MKHYEVSNVGCKVAQYEIQQVRSLLERFGLVEAGSQPPDLCVVNTCAVTAAAASKSRQAIRSLARRHPHADLVVLGCYASLASPSIRRLPQLKLIADHQQGALPKLHALLVRHHTKRTEPASNAGSSDTYTNYANTHIQTDFTKNVKDNFADYTVQRFDHRHRAFLKVQDGCDAHCTYCIIPKLRPRLESAPRDNVLNQARRFIDAGHREIVLSGVFLGAYGKSTAKHSRLREPAEPLAELIADLLALTGLGRLRLSSLEPGDVTASLLAVLAKSDKFASHLHLPLQHGADRILKRMGRHYTAGQYLAAVARAREHLVDLAVTTDVIVGFPSESEDDFAATLDMARRVGFAKIHIFPFSPRPGTAAARWQDDMPARTVIQERLAMIRGLEQGLARRFRTTFVGREVRVLVENVEHFDHSAGETVCRGRADAYFPVRFPGRDSLDNKLVRVRVDGVGPVDDAVVGTLAETLDS